MFRKITFLVLIVFSFYTVFSPLSIAQTWVGSTFLPEPGAMIQPSNAIYTPAHIRALTVNPTNPFHFTFLIHQGDTVLSPDEKKEVYNDLINYFLASLTIPDQNQWVNLSPYEGDRLIEHSFGLTNMGRELLAQDYLLKQLTASLLHPDLETGKKFWEEIYQKAYQLYGKTEIPLDTFNKVWIVPDEAVIVENETTAYLISQNLRVYTEKDYLSMKASQNPITPVQNKLLDETQQDTAELSSNLMREIIIPVLEKEVNESETFAALRQITTAMILATWYKKTLKDSVLGQKYANKSKTDGINQDPENNEKIYQQYLQAFQKGVFNMIREDMDVYSQEMIPRKYFSGGVMRVEDSSQVTKIISLTHDKVLQNINGMKSFYGWFKNKVFDSVDVAFGISKRKQSNERKKQISFTSHIVSLMVPDMLNSLFSTPEEAWKNFEEKLNDFSPNFTEEELDLYKAFTKPQEVEENHWRLVPSLSWFTQKAFEQPESRRSFVDNAWIDVWMNLEGELFLPFAIESHYPELLKIAFWHYAYPLNERSLIVSLTPDDSLEEQVDEALSDKIINRDKLKEIFSYLSFSKDPVLAHKFGTLTSFHLAIKSPFWKKKTALQKEQPLVDVSQKASPVGGIDLNAMNIHLEIKTDVNGFLMPITMEDLENFELDGLVSEILSIEPAVNLPFLSTILESI